MRSALALVAVVVLSACQSANTTLRRAGVAEEVFVLAHVTVLPMHEDVAWTDRSVLVRGGVIERIEPAEHFAPPPGSRVIDGRGRFLLPGLADLHVHPASEDDLVLFVANGITTIRVMSDSPGWARLFGFPDMLRLRRQVAQGELIGPRIVTAGVILDGAPRTSPMMREVVDAPQAIAETEDQVRAGADFVKVYDNLDPETFSAILQTARTHSVPAAGHVPKSVPLETALTSGLVSIEHLTGYYDNDAVRFRIPEGELAEAARHTREAGVWNCPTLVIFAGLVPPERFDEIAARPESDYVSWGTQVWWYLTLRAVYGNAQYEGDDYAARVSADMQRITRALHAEGAPLIAGTDANFVGVVPGFSLHRELELLVDAGLSPYAALRAATYDAAVFLGREGEVGSIQPGRRAELVLLAADPREDIRHTRRIEGVLVSGVWFDRAALDTALAAVAD